MVKIPILQAMAWIERYETDAVARWEKLKELLVEQDTRSPTLRAPVLSPAQFGVNLAIRTGPNSENNKFSKWIVTPRSQGGALPDEYRVKHCAVWRVDQFHPGTDALIDGELPFAMPNEDDFLLNLLGLHMSPTERHADWGRYTR